MTFEIEPSATWSDGAPIVAADWLTSAKAVARSKKSPHKQLLQELVGFAEYSAGTSAAITGIRAEAKRLTVEWQRAGCQTIVRVFYYIPPIPTHVFGKYINDADPSASAAG